MKLKAVGKNPNKPMLALDEEGKKVWYFATEKAYNSAKTYLKEGDGVEIKLADEEKEGLKVITFIAKIGADNPPVSEKGEEGNKCTECGYPLKDERYTKCYNCNQKGKNDKVVENFSSDSPKCIDCGKVLKDSKYKKCYDCNQKNPVKTETSSSKSTSIEKQNVNNAVSRTLIALQGQIDRNDLSGLIDMLWKIYYDKLKK